MKKYYVIGEYSGEDLFAKAIDVYGGFRLTQVKDVLFDEFQEPLNARVSILDSFEHKTYEQIKETPVVTDGWNYWGIFKVKANSSEEAARIPLRVNGKINNSNQVI